MAKTIVAGALGNCVHVAGVAAFLRAAERLGYKTVFLGAAVSVERFAEEIERWNPDIVGVSYRLTPEVGLTLARELKEALLTKGLDDRCFVFGGTPPVCAEVEKLNWFEKCFSGTESDDAVWTYLCEDDSCKGETEYGDTLIKRIKSKYPYPVLRHHYGLPNIEDTVTGVKRIAESGTLDVISIAPDQNAQEYFFRPESMDRRLDGAGGVPVRSEEDLFRLYEASQCGNYPLLRIYSGTRDLLKWADLSVRTVRNAWAVPLCWYSALDGRSDRMPETAIRENQECMAWYGKRMIPVEVNEAHHWSMRDAHDTISVVMAYLAAYNAKRMGVSLYVSQYMFNSPAGTVGAMDLAKILAQLEMVESLHSSDFFTVRQIRAGLLHLSPDMNRAKGQLAASTVLALTVKPHIIHVVGFCEGDHAASADDVIESCGIVHGVLKNCLVGMPAMADDPLVRERKQELLAEAETMLRAIRDLDDKNDDPFVNPRVIAGAIGNGILDAPHLKGNPFAAGELVTSLIDGAVYAIDPSTGGILSERKRLSSIGSLKEVVSSDGRNLQAILLQSPNAQLLPSDRHKV